MNIELRDYFAAHAPSPQQPMELAEHCAYRYRYADAMLAAREAGKQKLNDGWIEWHGGECPVDADTVVEVRLASTKVVTGLAADYQWSNDDPWTVRIIAYRVVQP